MSEDKNTENEDELTLGDDLADVPFGEMLSISNVIGSKEFKKKVFGNDSDTRRRKQFHRENKNRPTEMSSKIIPRKNRNIKNEIPRDPRFDSFCGVYNPKKFQKSYEFLNKLRKKERSLLVKELKNPSIDEEERHKISSLIQRMNNKINSAVQLKRKERLELEEKQSIIEDLKQGKHPHYKNKSEKKLLELVTQYEELKRQGKLNSHIKKRRKKNALKDKIKMRLNHYTEACPDET